MKEIKILLIVLVMIGVTYWGIEPLAHSVMHPKVSDVNFDFSASDKEYFQKQLNSAKNSNELAKMQDNFEKYKQLWQKVGEIDLSKGNATTGAETFAMACGSCHGVLALNMPNPLGDDKTISQALGVAAPDLSNAGYIYDDKFLAALIIDPVLALKVGHFFNDEKPFPMTPFFGLGGDFNQEVADIVAYIKSIAPKNLSNKALFRDACERCHDMKYAKLCTLGNKQSLYDYVGSNPPDLSMMIRSKGVDYLHKFINDPQKMLPNTAMVRVGLNQKAQNQVVSYLQEVGDSKKAQRQSVAVNIMIYFAILAVFATLWKRKIWSNLH